MAWLVKKQELSCAHDDKYKYLFLDFRSDDTI